MGRCCDAGAGRQGKASRWMRVTIAFPYHSHENIRIYSNCKVRLSHPLSISLSAITVWPLFSRAVEQWGVRSILLLRSRMSASSKCAAGNVGESKPL